MIAAMRGSPSGQPVAAARSSRIGRSRSSDPASTSRSTVVAVTTFEMLAMRNRADAVRSPRRDRTHS